MGVGLIQQGFGFHLYHRLPLIINFIRTYADERGNPIPRGSDGPASGYRLTECPRMGKDGGESVVSRATRGATG